MHVPGFLILPRNCHFELKFIDQSLISENPKGFLVGIKNVSIFKVRSYSPKRDEKKPLKTALQALKLSKIELFFWYQRNYIKRGTHNLYI